jgi:hydrogenase maturation protease
LSNHLLILGIGNSLMGDDGVGVHAARELAKAPPVGTTVVDGGTDFLSVVPLLESHAQVLVIDAMEIGGAPGTLYRCPASAIDTSSAKDSPHERSLLSVLEFIEADKRPEIHFLGVQPEKFDYSLELSPQVAAALPAAIQEAREFAAGLLRNEPVSAAR